MRPWYINLAESNFTFLFQVLIPTNYSYSYNFDDFEVTVAVLPRNGFPVVQTSKYHSLAHLTNALLLCGKSTYFSTWKPCRESSSKTRAFVWFGSPTTNSVRRSSRNM